MTDSPAGTVAQDRVLRPQQRFSLPPGAREILLVRHGSADGLKAETLLLGEMTLHNPPLLPRGHEQAKLVAERLRNEPITVIFVTPFQRTHQTAAPLVATTGLEPVAVADLRECFLGDWEHSFYEKASAGHPLLKRMMEEESWSVIPNAETMEDFGARIRRGVEVMVDAVKPDCAAVAFLHAGTISEICRQATGSRPFAFFGPENTSISRLVISASGKWTLRSFNDVSHLQALT